MTEGENMAAWYRQKTTWTGISAVVTGVGLMVAGEMSAGIQAVTTGFVAIFLRQGIAKLKG